MRSPDSDEHIISGCIRPRSYPYPKKNLKIENVVRVIAAYEVLLDLVTEMNIDLCVLGGVDITVQAEIPGCGAKDIHVSLKGR
jgi:hypothetical protein